MYSRGFCKVALRKDSRERLYSQQARAQARNASPPAGVGNPAACGGLKPGCVISSPVYTQFGGVYDTSRFHVSSGKRNDDCVEE
jgi:hypothetical protein